MELKRGINLGGFLSQCIHEWEHYETFIEEEDLKKIAQTGFDHVRLPIDYEVLEEDNGKAVAAGYEIVETVIHWCEKYDLNIILDLHKAYGYDFNKAGSEGENSLFESQELQNRFVNLWKNILQHFHHHENVAYELLNEVVEQENADAWNQLIKKALGEIRKISKDAIVIYGGIQWNSVKTLKLLEIPEDKNVIYTFHFYEPLLFTHQKAYWVPTIDPNEDIFYPESMDYYKTKSKKIGYQGEVVIGARSKTMGVEFITEMIGEAIDAASVAGVSLYCGEFGVIDMAPIEDTLRWFSDVNTVFEKYNIGFSVWTYKKMDFGITDSHYDGIRKELLQLWNV